MSILDSIQQQAKTISNFITLFSRAKASNRVDKIANNTKSLKSVVSSKFKEVTHIVPQTPLTITQGATVLKRYSEVMSSKFNENIEESRMLNIFKESYVFLTKILVFTNTGIGGGAAVYTATKGWGIVIVPLSVICTLSVFTNAKKHGIQPEQAFSNFRRSFKEFLDREKATKKEKAFAYMPWLLIGIASFICNQWGDKILWDVLKDHTPTVEIGAGKISSGVKAVMDIGGEFSFNQPKEMQSTISFLKNIKLKEVTIFFTIAIIIYLFLSILDQMVLRKGEASTEI